MWRGCRIYIRLWLYWHVSKLNCDYIHLQITLKFFIFVISLHIRGVCLQNCISKSFYVYSFIWFFGFSQIHMRFFSHPLLLHDSSSLYHYPILFVFMLSVSWHFVCVFCLQSPLVPFWPLCGLESGNDGIRNE